MNRPIALAALCAAALAACSRKPAPDLTATLAELNSMCLMPPLHARMASSPDAPAAERKKRAFENYYVSFLDAKEMDRYALCLEKRWSLPWLHGEYREARGWLKDSRDAVAEVEPLFAEGERIADVQETFPKRKGGRVVVRVTITRRDKTKTVVEKAY